MNISKHSTISDKSALYLHIPFCKRKCIYCNFYSVAKLGLMENFIKALILEMSESQKTFPHHHFSTLYFGGGTPTLLSSSQWQQIMEQLYKYFSFARNIEFTIEANPEQLTLSNLQMLKNLGINRLSIGIQSFNNAILAYLGRAHSGEQAQKAVYMAAEAGFDNISIDLMYGISERASGDWERDLQMALALPAKHISAYSLTIEENTILQRRLKCYAALPPNENAVLQDYAILQQHIEQANFVQYEVSNYCQPGYASQHNSAYWNGTPYLGLGPSAHSFYENIRKWNVAHIEQYIDALQCGQPYWQQEQLSERNLYNEYIMLGLRTTKGIDFQHINEIFGTKYLDYLLACLPKIDANFYEKNAHQLKLSPTGLLLADYICTELFAEAEE